ncbi:hypothetical protein [Spirosoma endbachense]|uniref:DUF4386 family protein n=1 Tax=Spirosoma endbachense TaxID=2666025 RepID=A0A6P1W7W7_9BACT|nr:hypothetical protein [Spirosoma endbachense]QHW00110.1 hypothetical protein GJR95_36085 [Spirosoma endbachense]
MKTKLLITFTALLLVILPFLVSAVLGNYSPYVDGNSFQNYILIWIVISIGIVSIALLLFNYFHQSFEKIPVGGMLLFLLVWPIIGIYGLASAPDLSVKMLEHPEREHLRYSLLFLALILFGCFALFLFSSNSLKIKKTTRWIMTVIFIIAIAEYTWEFTHHYLYPEGLKEWVSQGKNPEEFGKNYDNFNMITIGVIGRYVQFILVIWLSLHLYKLQQIKIWSPIINTMFSLVGIVSATLIFITEMNLPKGFEFLFLFFIPGIPFFLLYWLGIALLTKLKKRDITA